jgi:hypothetical protein
MSSAQPTNSQTAKPTFRRKLYCIIDSMREGVSAAVTLNAAGVEGEIQVFQGETGVEQLKKLMESAQWGETAENAYQDGISALHDGKTVIIADAASIDDARRIGAILKPFGAHEIIHFGDLVDTALTA